MKGNKNAWSGYKISCLQGDSGGALTTFVTNRIEQVGIVSLGNKCGKAKRPGVYTEVDAFLVWILRKIRQ